MRNMPQRSVYSSRLRIQTNLPLASVCVRINAAWSLGPVPATNGGKRMEKHKRASSLADFCSRYGIGRTRTYDEINAGRLKVVKVGKRTLVPEDSAESWLKSLTAVTPKTKT